MLPDCKDMLAMTIVGGFANLVNLFLQTSVLCI